LLLSLLAAATALGLAYPAILGRAFDVLRDGADAASLWTLAALLLGATVLAALLAGAVSYLQTVITARVLLDLRDRAFDSLQSTGLEVLSKRRLGDLMSRLGSDLNEVQQIATGTLLALVGGVLTLTFACMALIYIDPMMFAVALCFVPASAAIAAAVRKPIRSGAMRVKERAADSASVAVDALRGQRLVRSLGTEGIEAKRFHRANVDLVRSVLGLQAWQVASGVGAQILIALTAFVVLLVGAARIRAGVLTEGQLIAFALYQARLFAPAQGLVSLYLNLQRARASVERVFQIMDPPAAQAFGGGTRVAAPPLPLRCTDLAVARAGRTVVTEVSFEARPGHAVALVGRSGSGKSSVLDALAGLALRAGGSVEYADLALAQWEARSLRRQLALVDQEPLLRRGSLRHNLCYGLPGPEPDTSRLQHALEGVGLGHLDLGRELSDGGEGLSAGEGRRLALARALLRDPAVLLLDEVAANLDAHNAEQIRRVVAQAVEQRTVVLATHRRSELELASHALWLDDGRVRDRGEPLRFTALMDDAGTP
jgi:ABC-type bacteriocin/lantibiotic exporter with double-glycine peptidase domain